MMKCSAGATLAELLDQDPHYLRLLGAEGEGDGSDSGGSGTDDEGDDDSGNGDDESGDGDKGKKTGQSVTLEQALRRLTNLEEERERNVTKREEAQAKARELQEEIDRLKKDGTTDEATKQELAELKRENDRLKTINSELALENAFFRDNTYKWKSPEAALKLANLSKVEIEDDGKVFGLAKALEDLAKESPWLLDEATGDKSDKKDDKKRTGDPAGKQRGNGDQKSRQATESRLRQKYPGLRR